MAEESKTPLTDYYSKPYQGKRYKENHSESLMVTGAIKIMAWIAIIVGIFGICNGLGNGIWIYGVAAIAISVFLFGFSAIVKAAYKYLNE